MTMTVPFTEENLLVEAVYLIYLFMYVLSSNRWEHLILTPSKGIPPPDPNDRTTIPTTNRNLNVIVVFPSLMFFPPLSLNPILVTVTPYYPKPLFPDATVTRAALGGGKPGHISASRNMSVKPPNTPGDSQTTYIRPD